MIAARRPNSPLLARPTRRSIVASAVPGGVKAAAVAVDLEDAPVAPKAKAEPAPRRGRIVQLARGDADEREKLRERLLDRLMASETRGAITRAADEYIREGFSFPEEQPIQLQLLEHFAEERARDAIAVLSRLLGDQPPHKKPILVQRLRRLEEYADEQETQRVAEELRRSIRP
jgi:hypothetical protein